MNLKKLRVLITAGPTREFFDPVRFLSNPSSGKMGYAIAEAAVKKSFHVILVSGPTAMPPPKGLLRFVRVTSADEMYRVVMKEAARSDVIFMAAAVSDYRPAAFVPQKVKKTGKRTTIALVPNRDILKELGRRRRLGQVLVGFAAETEAIGVNALKKLRSKNLDWIVANRVGTGKTGFESDRNRALLISSQGVRKSLPLMSKKKLAEEILKACIHLSSRKPSA